MPLTTQRLIRFAAIAMTLAALSGCDLLGLENVEQINAKKEADGRAIGSACRHAMRAIEDCYVLNPKAVKASIFAGWREMDEYMRENKLEGVAPTVPRAGDKASSASTSADDGEDDPKPAKSAKSGKH